VVATMNLPIGCPKADLSHRQVANVSPIPVIIYSYPAVSSGIVMDTDLVRRLAKHPNIVGIKHTDHEVGRIAREASIKSYGCE
jgi:dihydrodipicolinate synthase/N-acetylneuraminate lyase